MTALADSSVLSQAALCSDERQTVCEVLEKMLNDLEERLYRDEPQS